MRKFLIVTALLAAVLMGIMFYSVSLLNAGDALDEDIHIQTQQLESKKEQLEQKKQELAQLTAQLEIGPEEDQEWIRLQEDVQLLEAQKTELETQIQQIAADTEALKAKLQSEENDQSYFLEVYNALTKGLNDVKGYLSGN